MRKLLYLLLLFIPITVYFLFSNQAADPKSHFGDDLEYALSFRKEKAYDSIIFYSKKELSSTTHEFNKVVAYGIIGRSFYNKREYDSAYFYYTKSIEYSKKVDSSYKKSSEFFKATSYNMLGLIFKKQHLYIKAIKYFEAAIDIVKDKDKSSICSYYYNLADTQSLISDINCVESYYKALEYATHFKINKYEASCRSNLGFLMLETNNITAAEEYFTQALESEYAQNNQRITSFCLQGLGEANYHHKKYGLALDYAQKSLIIKQEENIEEHLFSSFLLLARIHKNKNNLEIAEGYYKKALIYFSNTKQNRESIDVFKELSDVQYEVGKYNQSEINNQNHFDELEKFLQKKTKATKLAALDSNLLSFNYQKTHTNQNLTPNIAP
ncbi:MAG: tetratricopeptide repeat protein [Reichenbachiella sp.]